MKRFTAMILAVLMVLTIAAGAVGEENKIWFKGDTGEKVTWIQTRLKELEYLDKEPNGVFDEDTERALTDFQSYQGLLVTGMADSVTMQALETATTKKSELRNRIYDDMVYEAAEYDAGISYSESPAALSTSMPMAKM